MSIRIPPFRGLAGPRFSARRSSWAPTALTNFKAWYDLGDLTLLFKDTAAATPVTAVDDLMARFNAKAGVGAPYWTQATSGNRPALKAISGAVGLGARFDGTRFMDSSSATFFNFMHNATGGTMLMSLAWNSADSGGYDYLFSTNDDAAPVGVSLALNDTSTAVGRFYGWLCNGSGAVINGYGTNSDNAHGTSLTTFVWGWQDGYTGNDATARLGGVEIFSANSLLTPSASNSQRTPRLCGRSGSIFGEADVSIRDLVFCEGRLSAVEMALFEAWALTR